MEFEQFCLKWNNFQTNILAAFESLQTTEDLADVTLACEGTSIKAHKFILSVCSPYFRNIFKENPCPHPVVILKDVLYSDLISLLNFIYHGEVMVTKQQLPTFFKTAEALQISGLKSLPGIYTRKKTKRVVQENEAEIPKRLKVRDVAKETDESKIGVEVKETEHSKVETDELDANLTNTNNAQENKSASILERTLQTCKSSDTHSNESLNETGDCIKKTNTLGNSKQSTSNTEYEEVIPEDILQAKIKIETDETDDPGDEEISHLEKESSILERTLQTSSGKSPSNNNNTPHQASDANSKKQDASDSESGYSIDNQGLEGPAGLQDAPAHHSSQCGNCPHCGLPYSNQSALKYHVRLVHSDLLNLYCCYLCPLKFCYRDSYKKHMSDMHSVRS